MSAISAIFSVSQSQKSFRPFSHSSTLIPTSMTRLLGRIIFAVMRCFLPTAAMTISAFFVCSVMSIVLLWQTVTVAPAWRRSIARGFQTIVLLPMTTAFFPRISQRVSSMIFMMPFGVHGTSHDSFPL